ADQKNDRNFGGCRLCRKCRRRSRRDDCCDRMANQVDRQRRQPIDLILCPSVCNSHVLAFDKAYLLQALSKSSEPPRYDLGCSGVKKSDCRQRGSLLCVNHERPRRRRATKTRNELAPPHCTPSPRTGPCYRAK